MEQQREMIAFSEAIVSYWKHLFSWKGRATQAELWFSFLFVFIALVVLPAGTFRALFSLTCIPGILSLNIRRLHDMGKSGTFLWKILFYTLLSIIGTLLGVMLLKFLLLLLGVNSSTVTGYASTIFIVGGFLMVYSIPFCIWGITPILGFFSSEKKDNKYGPY
ncbi:MAG: DUF805 domain-containing protein [Alphaproteobacteria bacterium]|nr:DUF805 domain-containing protein [Alphaproteobacteria bacterium]